MSSSIHHALIAIPAVALLVVTAGIAAEQRESATPEVIRAVGTTARGVGKSPKKFRSGRAYCQKTAPTNITAAIGVQ